MPAQRTEEQIKLNHTVYLIKNEIEDFKEVLELDKVDSSFDLYSRYNLNAKLYVGHNDEKAPDWLTEINKGVRGEIPLFNRNSKAVLLVKRRSRIFAYLFGRAHHMLKTNSYVRDFGLKVVLNNCQKDKIKSLFTSTVDAKTMHTKYQPSTSSSILDFNINDFKDFLREIKSETVDYTRYGKEVSGKDYFKFYKEFKFGNLKEYCDFLLNDYNSRKYLSDFKWVDNLKIVSDPSLVEMLNEELESIINSDDADELHLAVPEIIDNSEDILYSYTEKGNREESVDIDSFLTSKKVEQWNIQNLKSHQIYCFVDGGLDTKWRVYDCLVLELQMDDEQYIFSFGDWFKIDSNFIEEIEDKISQLNDFTEELPVCRVNTEKEYNLIVEREVTNIKCMDMNNINVEGNVIEFCDLLSLNKAIIHVKPWNSSSTLSHLFAQARVSADSFTNISDFKQRVIDKLDGGYRAMFNGENVKITDFAIVLALIYEGDLPVEKRLPFFSKLNYAHTIDWFKSRGISLQKAHIKKEID